jgi:hypothetical protein
MPEISLDHLDRQLTLLFKEIAVLRQMVAVPPQIVLPLVAEPHEKFVTIDFFVKDMLGYKSRITYYNHIGDEGWPQRVYPAGKKPKLLYEECIAYVQSKTDARDGNTVPPPEPSPGPVVKRRVGRPVKPPRNRR